MVPPSLWDNKASVDVGLAQRRVFRAKRSLETAEDEQEAREYLDLSMRILAEAELRLKEYESELSAKGDALMSALQLDG